MGFYGFCVSITSDVLRRHASYQPSRACCRPNQLFGGRPDFVRQGGRHHPITPEALGARANHDRGRVVFGARVSRAVACADRRRIGLVADADRQHHAGNTLSATSRFSTHRQELEARSVAGHWADESAFRHQRAPRPLRAALLSDFQGGQAFVLQRGQQPVNGQLQLSNALIFELPCRGGQVDTLQTGDSPPPTCSAASCGGFTANLRAGCFDRTIPLGQRRSSNAGQGRTLPSAASR